MQFLSALPPVDGSYIIFRRPKIMFFHRFTKGRPKLSWLMEMYHFPVVTPI
jgi:hypothetical protein